MAFAGDKIFAKFFQSTLLPLWLRYGLWFLDNLFWFDWRCARNRIAALVEEIIEHGHF
jgi:hypothetical protein